MYFAFYLLNKFPNIQVDTLTISKKQFDYVSEKSKSLGYESNLNVIYKDYREHLGQYNRVYSIEMFEAVGMEFWNDYFSKIRDLLIPKGIFSMQTIVIDNKYFNKYIVSRKEIKKGSNIWNLDKLEEIGADPENFIKINNLTIEPNNLECNKKYTAHELKIQKIRGAQLPLNP